MELGRSASGKVEEGGELILTHGGDLSQSTQLGLVAQMGGPARLAERCDCPDVSYRYERFGTNRRGLQHRPRRVCCR